MIPLPIDAVLPEIIAAVRDHRAAVVVAAPGAGKTTRVPQALLDSGIIEGRILVLQPRRVAARSAAARIAEERGVRLGAEVGYHVRFDRKSSAKTRIELLTEGLLTRRLQTDPFLDGVGCVILDEFHERSLHADLGLALLREVRQEARPDLAVVVMSATLDPDPVAAFLSAPVITSEGRTYPVEIIYDTRSNDRRVHERCAAAIRDALRSYPDGHVLVFLPGVGEIERTADTLGELRGVHVYPLHGRLSAADQDLALAPSAQRKVVLATNIAETSITLDGVRVVIDSGLARVPRFDPAIGLSRLERTRISQASADQRAGRAGRTGPGVCRRLWTRAEQTSMPATERPAIHRVDLTRATLEIHGWGADPTTFEWFEPPTTSGQAQADLTLKRLGAVNDGGLTTLGQQLLALPLHPRLGRVLIEGHRLGHVKEAAAIGALASERDLFRHPPDMVGDSDLALRLDVLDGQRVSGIDRGALRRVRQTRDQLLRVAHQALGRQPSAPWDERALVQALLAGFPDRVGRRRAPRSARFKLAGGVGAVQDDSSIVRDAEFIVAVVLAGGRRGERAEHRIRLAAALDPADLPIEEVIETVFEPERGAVIERRVRRYLDLVLDSRPTGNTPDAQAVGYALAQAICENPRQALQLDADDERLLARIRWLADKRPKLNLPTFAELDPDPSIDTPGPFLQMICTGKRSLADLRKMRLTPLFRAQLGHQAQTLDRLAPARLKLPDGQTARLEYSDGPPVLAARIQQLFGWHETPLIAGIPIQFHLLAPNMRPAQITQDLGGFWRSTYADVRKDLRGRYPKHYWPEDPLTATPRPRRRRR